jgi:hypothetical protein
VTNLGRPKRFAISFFLCSAAFEVCLFGSKRFNPKERTKQLNRAETARKATSWRKEGGSAGPRLFDMFPLVAGSTLSPVLVPPFFCPFFPSSSSFRVVVAMIGDSFVENKRRKTLTEKIPRR